jgi:CubicO group peptidase (beta-lactamase class C family)
MIAAHSPERWDYPMLTVGDGGLFSTLDDLFLWDQALNTERLVSKATLELAFTSGITNDRTPVGYGFGWYTNVFPLLSTAEREQLLALGADIRHVAHGGGCVAYYNYMGIPGPRIRAHRGCRNPVWPVR